MSNKIMYTTAETKKLLDAGKNLKGSDPFNYEFKLSGHLNMRQNIA